MTCTSPLKREDELHKRQTWAQSTSPAAVRWLDGHHRKRVRTDLFGGPSLPIGAGDVAPNFLRMG